jgi:hypothetical protein
MGSLKFVVVEVDSVDLEYPTEYDLSAALTYIGFNPQGFDVDIILTNHKGEVISNHLGNVLVKGE